MDILTPFLQAALPLVDRGFHVFPLIPKSKRPVRMAGDMDHFDAATTEPEQLRMWSEQVPDANVGLSPDEIFCFLETDDEADLKAACAAIPAGAWDTTRVSARENRCYYIFRQTSRTRRAGNMTVTRKGKENLFEFKQHRVYCTGPGSIHPMTGKPYVAAWRNISAMPDVLLNRLCELYGAPEPGNRTVMSGETKHQTDLLDRFLATYEVATTGDWFNKGEQWYRPIECPWASEHENANAGTSTCVVYTEGGGYGFDCKHRCSTKGWKEFRAELVRRFPNLRFSFVGDAALGDGPAVTLSRSADLSPDDFEPEETTTRPVYPDQVWKGTPYGDFADYCAAGNFIPKRFFSEALRSVVGAVVGCQLSTDYQGVNPRAYTVLIGPPGSGKGTAITAARQFVECEFDSQRRSSERPLLWDDAHDPLNWCWPSRYIGAHVVSPASAPGLIQATKPRKLEKGESRSPLEVWKPLPRFITIQEEIGGLFANFANENSGRGLETAILELYDRDSFTTTATNERSAKSGRLLYSVLGGIPKTEWDNIFARSSSVGSGLFSRLNIIGTENERTVAGLPEYDFGEMQRVFLPRITALERTPTRILLSPDGRQLLNEWFARLSEKMKAADLPAARLNIHALRVALHLAWLRGHANILESDVDAGIKVADFQAKMREFYRPAEGETREAQWENRIMKTMCQKRSLPYRELQRLVTASRAGTAVWERAIAGLKRDERIAVVDEVTKSGQKRKTVKLLKRKD